MRIADFGSLVFTATIIENDRNVKKELSSEFNPYSLAIFRYGRYARKDNGGNGI